MLLQNIAASLNVTDVHELLYSLIHVLSEYVLSINNLLGGKQKKEIHSVFSVLPLISLNFHSNPGRQLFSLILFLPVRKLSSPENTNGNTNMMYPE